MSQKPSAQKPIAEQPGADEPGEDRRKGPKERRTAAQDRRNAERVAEDVTPRRHPDITDRRKTDD